MKTSQIIFLGLALFLTVQATAGHHGCNCGLGPGIDACAGVTEVVVKPSKPIRPVKFVDPYMIREIHAAKAVPITPPCGARKMSGPIVTDLHKHNSGPIAPRFEPVGDLCSTCKKNIAEVVPAYPGKPICRSCSRQHGTPIVEPQPSYADPPTTRSFTTFTHVRPDLNTFDDDYLSFDDQEQIYNTQPVSAAPADPVSLSLAYGLARQTSRTVPEGSLAFGPKSTPIDGRTTKTASNIPEEKLLTVERPVVELRFTPKQTIHSAYDQVLAQQEVLEQQRIELEAQAADDPQSGSGVPFVSYSDLGYAPVTSTGNNFVSTTQHVYEDPTQQDPAAEDPAESGCGPLGRPIPGYVSGNVIIRSEAGQENDANYYGEGSYEQESSAEQYQDSQSSESSEEQDPSRGRVSVRGSWSAGNSGHSSYSAGASGLLARLRASAHAQNGHGRGCGCGCGH